MSKQNRIEPELPVPPQPQAAPAALKPKQTFCTWLEEKKIEATINLVIVSFKIPLNCKTILVVLGLVVIGALILIIPRVQGNTCAYAGIASTDEEAIVWSINAEGEAVVEENMGAIEKIFSPDAVFIDRLTQEKWFSPLERYTHLFAAADYAAANHIDIKAAARVEGKRASFISGSRGTYIADGITSSYATDPDSDHWTLEKQRGCWVITKFEFNASGYQFP